MPPLLEAPTPEGPRQEAIRRYATGRRPASQSISVITSGNRGSSETSVEDTQERAEPLSLLLSIGKHSITPTDTKTFPETSSAAPSPESIRSKSLVQRRKKVQQQIKSAPNEKARVEGTSPPQQQPGILKKLYGTINQDEPAVAKVAKRKVLFSSNEEIHQIPIISMETDPELASAIWYSPEEYEAMKEVCELVLDLLQLGIIKPYTCDDPDTSGSVIQNDDYCSVGFDSCYGCGREMAEAFQKGARAAVLLEQEMQFLDGYVCEELIRSAYLEFSSRAESMALERGRNHAKAAGDWVRHGLPMEYVQWLYTHLGRREPLEYLVSDSSPTEKD